MICFLQSNPIRQFEKEASPYADIFAHVSWQIIANDSQRAGAAELPGENLGPFIDRLHRLGGLDRGIDRVGGAVGAGARKKVRKRGQKGHVASGKGAVRHLGHSDRYRAGLAGFSDRVDL